MTSRVDGMPTFNSAKNDFFMLITLKQWLFFHFSCLIFCRGICRWPKRPLVCVTLTLYLITHLFCVSYCTDVILWPIHYLINGVTTDHDFCAVITVLPQSNYSWDIPNHYLLHQVIHADDFSTALIKWHINVYCGCGQLFYHPINQHAELIGSRHLLWSNKLCR